MGLAPTPAGMGPGDLTQTPAELGVIGERGGDGSAGWSAVGRSPCRPALRDPETLLEGHGGPPTTLRGQKFPSANSLSMSMSSACSATIFFRRPFSCSNSLRRFISSPFIPA